MTHSDLLEMYVSADKELAVGSLPQEAYDLTVNNIRRECGVLGHIYDVTRSGNRWCVVCEDQP